MQAGTGREGIAVCAGEGEELPDTDPGEAGRTQCGRPPDLEADASAAGIPDEPVHHEGRERKGKVERIYRQRCNRGCRCGYLRERVVPAE